jgi:hypothetical protein
MADDDDGEEEREQYRLQQERVNDELDNRKGRPWKDPWEISEDQWMQSDTNSDSLPDWSPAYVSRISLERLQVLPIEGACLIGVFFFFYGVDFFFSVYLIPFFGRELVLGENQVYLLLSKSFRLAVVYGIRNNFGSIRLANTLLALYHSDTESHHHPTTANANTNTIHRRKRHSHSSGNRRPLPAGIGSQPPPVPDNKDLRRIPQEPALRFRQGLRRNAGQRSRGSPLERGQFERLERPAGNR